MKNRRVSHAQPFTPSLVTLTSQSNFLRNSALYFRIAAKNAEILIHDRDGRMYVFRALTPDRTVDRKFARPRRISQN